jgi:hypothetical protein
MSQDDTDNKLAARTPDYVASAAKAALGAVPFAGSLLAEIAGSIIPNQRIERVVDFAVQLESRLSEVERGALRAGLADENFTDLMEEALRQVARSVSRERRAKIAELILNGLAPGNVSFIESKHLLRILGETNDIEIVRLTSHLFETMGSGAEYWATHREVLEPVAPTMGSSQDKLDKATLQDSYDEHLARLGVLRTRYDVDSRSNQLAVDRVSGQLKVRGYELTSLGRLLLRQLGVQVDEERANIRMEPTRP